MKSATLHKKITRRRQTRSRSHPRASQPFPFTTFYFIDARYKYEWESTQEKCAPEEKNTWRADPDPRRHIPSWSNPNEVRAQGKNASQRLRTGIEYPAASVSRNVAGVSSSKGPAVCSGSAALGIQALSQSNPKNVRAKDKNITQRLVGKERNDIEYPGTSGSRRMISSSRGPDDSPGAAALDNQACYRGATKPGAVRLGHLDDDDDYEEQTTDAARDESIIQIVAHVVDTEEENRRLHEQDQRFRELLHERNQLRQVIDNAVVVDPVVITDGDAENGNEQVAQGTENYGTLPQSDEDSARSKTGWGKCCDKYSFAGRVFSIILASAGVVLSALTAFQCDFIKTENVPVFDENGLSAAHWAQICAIFAPVCGFIASVLYLFELLFFRFRCARFIQIVFILVTEVALCFTFFSFNTEEYRYDRFENILDSSDVCSISNAAIYTIVAFGSFLIAGIIGFCTPKPRPVITWPTHNDHDLEGMVGSKEEDASKRVMKTKVLRRNYHEDMVEPMEEEDEQASDEEEGYANESMYDASVYDEEVYDEETMAS